MMAALPADQAMDTGVEVVWEGVMMEGRMGGRMEEKETTETTKSKE
jgi:hypothetical protein